jgi:hypothetical protein
MILVKMRRSRVRLATRGSSRGSATRRRPAGSTSPQCVWTLSGCGGIALSLDGFVSGSRTSSPVASRASGLYHLLRAGGRKTDAVREVLVHAARIQLASRARRLSSTTRRSASKDRGGCHGANETPRAARCRLAYSMTEVNMNSLEATAARGPMRR